MIQRWFGTLKTLFANFPIFLYVKPLGVLIILIPKYIYLTKHNKNIMLTNYVNSAVQSPQSRHYWLNLGWHSLSTY